MQRLLLGVALAGATLLFGASVVAPEPDGDDSDGARLERLSAPATVPERPPLAMSSVTVAGHDVPLAGDAKHLIVDGTLNGAVRGPMLVDTGASYCVLTHRTARRLGLARRARTIPVATANGQIDAAFVRLDALELSDAHLGGVDAVVMDAVEPPLIGIVGLNFLTQFRFSVDLAAGTLRLER